MVDGSEKERPSVEELELELEAERAQARLAAEALLELRQSEARKGAILEAALDCIVSVDHEGKITEWNPAAARTFGYARVEAMGRSLVDLLVPPSLRKRHMEGFRRYLESGQGTILGKRIEITALRAGGEEFPVELTVVATRSPGPPTFTAYIRDLTERKRAEQALEASEIAARQAEQALKRAEERLRHSQKMEALGRLAGGIAHDFNNLLSVIMSYSTMLSQSLPADAPARHELEQITRASQRAANLTRQLLAVSRQQVLRPRSIDLNETLGALREMLGRLIGEDIELVFRLGARSPVHVDPGQMEQVLMNLVLNSRDAMPNGGTLTIETRDVEPDAESAPAQLDAPAGACVMLAVSDTGVGMDAATLGRVFEPFFTTKEAGKGTGLGLSTVFGIVEQSGGSLSAESEPGRGTVFRVYLPKAAYRVSTLETPAGGRPTLGGSETVLLVEDDEQVRHLARAVLAAHGYRVLEAASGGDALVLGERFQGDIDVLLTDVVMPGMNGRQLAERVLATRPATRVLFMSGYMDDSIMRRGVSSADLALIQKPFLPHTLLAKLREVLDSADAEP